MRRPTWLDRIVYGFQHRWETAPQFRAMASGLVGLVLILIMCSCMGVLNATASSALAAIGLGGSTNVSAQGTPNTGTNQVNGYQAIPTPTVIYPTGVVPPQATVPQSQTPPPNVTPTSAPSPTPTDTPTSGGGGGGGGGSCNGGGNGTTWVIGTCPPHAGKVVTLTINAPGHGNQQLGLEIKWGGTSSDSACFWIFQPTTLDSNGSWTNSQTVPADCTGPVTGNYSVNGGGFVVISGPNMV